MDCAQTTAGAIRAVSGHEGCVAPPLLLISAEVPEGLLEQIEAGRHPRTDFYEIAREVGGHILDYGAVRRSKDPAVRWALRFFGRDVALALLGLRSLEGHGPVFTAGENVGFPLALLMRLSGRRHGHAMIAHRLTPLKKRIFHRLAGVDRCIDRYIGYATAQTSWMALRMGIPARKIVRIPFHADQEFFTPAVKVAVEPLLASAGLEWRDYPTLIEAVRGLPIRVEIGAASPWSRKANELAGGKPLPANVRLDRYDYPRLRDLYRRASVVVVPLYENDFQAGVTTILEAMACGCAVIATRTRGQGDVIEDGRTGIYVPPGDAEALRRAVIDLFCDAEKRARIGRAARRAIEEGMGLDHLAGRIGAQVRAAGREGA